MWKYKYKRAEKEVAEEKSDKPIQKFIFHSVISKITFRSFLPHLSFPLPASNVERKKRTRKKNERLRIFQDNEARRVVCAAREFFKLIFRLQFQFRGEYLVMWLCGVIKLKLFFLNYIIISEKKTSC